MSPAEAGIKTESSDQLLFLRRDQDIGSMDQADKGGVAMILTFEPLEIKRSKGNNQTIKDDFCLSLILIASAPMSVM